MPRNYTKKKTCNFTEQDLKSGTELLRKVVQTTGIPHTTLSTWVNDKNTSNFGSGQKNYNSFGD